MITLDVVVVEQPPEKMMPCVNTTATSSREKVRDETATVAVSIVDAHHAARRESDPVGGIEDGPRACIDVRTPVAASAAMAVRRDQNARR